MTPTIHCRLCGTVIQPATAERTKGVCMRCVRGPGANSDTILHRLIADNTPLPKVLTALQGALMETSLGVAQEASFKLQAEGIYGFWLYHHVFQYACATVFTEAGLDAVTRRYREQGNPDHTREMLRWSPCDSPHHLYRERAFGVVDTLFGTVERYGRSEAAEVEIHRALLRALRKIRLAKVFAPSVVLSLVNADHPPEEPYVYAEEFCEPAALNSFRTELGDLREDYLAHYRSGMPAY